MFFVPATIQPKYFINDNGEAIEINNYTSDISYVVFLYNKEDIISLGIQETSLNSLSQVTVDEAFEDSNLRSPTKGLYINNEVFNDTIILKEISKNYNDVSTYNADDRYFLYKISDDIFLILSNNVIQ